jgi:ribosome modulation factor
MMQHPQLLSTYGPEMVMTAIDDVADSVGEVEEIGGSDISAWVKQVEQTLVSMDRTDDPYDMDNPAPMESISEGDKQQNPWDQGYEAGFTGKMNCPYKDGTKERNNWESGYSTGREDRSYEKTGIREGKMKDQMYDDAERMELTDFLARWAQTPEDKDWVTEFWNSVHDSDANENKHPVRESKSLIAQGINSLWRDAK